MLGASSSTSPGGSILRGLAIYDAMHFIKPNPDDSASAVAMFDGLVCWLTPATRASVALPEHQPDLIISHRPGSRVQSTATSRFRRERILKHPREDRPYLRRLTPGASPSISSRLHNRHGARIVS